MTRDPRRRRRTGRAAVASILALLAGTAGLPGREWSFKGIPEPLEAEFVAMSRGFVVLRGPNGKSFEVPLESFSPGDRDYLRTLASQPDGTRPGAGPGRPITRRRDYRVESVESPGGRLVTLGAGSEFHVTGAGDALAGSSFNFTAPDGWLFLDRISPAAASGFIDRLLVDGAPAVPGTNIRVARHGPGSVIIPHPPDFPAMTLFGDRDLSGTQMALTCFVDYGPRQLAAVDGPVGSFILRRGYMATIARNEDGTGASRNYVAQDHDVVVDRLPDGLDEGVRFVRVFPWRWTGKKGVAGGIHQHLHVDWFYDWNIGATSSPDLEYVGIRQKRDWPGLDQDWQAKGITHLLGFNEPDRPDQAKMTVDEAIRCWPVLLATGLRLGSPATSDGGLGWLYEFIDKADRAGLRVDFVAVHYYRATASPGDARGAAGQLFRYLEEIHQRVKRPLWVTEWNNGANWTSAPDPDPRQQKAAIEAMIEMMDETPFVERYALYNWVEDCRKLVNDDGSLTPAGELYRDHAAPLAFTQPKDAR